MRLIDADDVLNSVWQKRFGLQMLDDTQSADKIMHGLFMAEQVIEKAKTVNAVPVVHGKWLEVEVIDDDETFGVNDAAQCSACGYIDRSGFYWPNTYYNYCPNCGAKMDGAEK